MGGVRTRQQMQNARAIWLPMDRPTNLMLDPPPGGLAGLGPFGTGASLAKPRTLPRGKGARA